MEKKWTLLILSCLVETAIWIFNIIHRTMRVVGIELVPLTYEKVIQPLSPEEHKETQRPDFSVPLEFFLEGYNRDPQTKGFQRLIALEKARDFAKWRTGVRNEIVKNPDILKTPVDSPLVIVGLPRTGTTMLHRLLQNDKNFLSTMMWEMIGSPVPPGRLENWTECERYKFAEKMFEYRKILGIADHANKHKFGFELEEECLFILNCYFIDTIDPITMQGPEEWRHFMFNYPEAHITNAYEFYKLHLKCIFYKNLNGGNRLSLKAPVHALYLDTYRQVFPDAKFVFTYRNITEMIGSYCSLMNEVGEQNRYGGDQKGIGKRTLEYYKNASAQTVKSLKAFSKESYIVLGYSEMTKDPMAAIKKIYTHFEMKLTPEAENAMMLHMKNNPKDKHGKHYYRLEDYGITEADLRETFAEFIDYFQDGTEKLL